MAKGKAGIFRDAAEQNRVADFSYQNDSVAQMITEAWTDQPFQQQILTRLQDGSSPNTKAALQARGIYLTNPVVITEAEYYAGYVMPDPNGVVFVLPNEPRIDAPPQHQSLLETARLLMACTPNGI